MSSSRNICPETSFPDEPDQDTKLITSSALTKINSNLSLMSLPRLEQISIYGSREIQWQPSLDYFTSKKVGKESYKNMNKDLRNYYKAQDKLIDDFEDMRLNGMTSVLDIARLEADDNTKDNRDAISLLSKITFFLNLLLLVMKVVAAVMSGSLSVISTVIDSAVDLVSGALIWWSMNAVKKRDIYKYPQGFTRIEPVVIVVLSVIMAVASMQMVRESGEKILELILSDTGSAGGPEFSLLTIIICLLTIVIKMVLYMVCRRFTSPSMKALSLDHRNDVMSNTVAVICGYIGANYWAYADPLGAVVICLYIITAWFATGWEQIKMLTGLTASPDFLKRVTWVCLNHHVSIILIDTVRAFHFGNNYLVEVDIVLPKEMTVEVSHDIAESLQRRMERMPECERCFVHIDVDGTHCPTREHKVV